MESGEEFDLPSGAKLFVSVSSWANIKALHDAVACELRGKGMGTLDLVEVQKAIIGEGEQGLNVVVDKMLGLASSKEVTAALFACAEKAVYRIDGTELSSVPVTPKLLDDPKYLTAAREDFYAICKRVAEVNLRPFTKALSSMFAGRAGRSAESQKSAMEPEPAKA